MPTHALRIDQLTFTRYLAALTVVFFHYGGKVFPASVGWVHPILTAGPIAVCYFYVLSGFIMAVAYYAPARPFDARRYWVARVARIYPVYLLALLLMVAAKFREAGSDPATVLLSVGMLQAWVPGYPLTLNAPGWSLSVEAFFYLCFPLLIFVTKRKHLGWIVGAALVLWLLTQTVHTLLLNSTGYAAFNALHDFIYYNPVMHLNTFLLGFVAGIWLREGKLSKLSLPYTNLAGLMAVCVVVCLLLDGRIPVIGYSGIKFDYTNGLIAPLFLILILLLASNTSNLSRTLRHPWLVLLGEASFSLYILQKPLHGIYEKVMPSWIRPDSALHFYLFLVVLTGAAILSYQLVETPLRRLINSFYPSSGKSG